MMRITVNRLVCVLAALTLGACGGDSAAPATDTTSADTTSTDTISIIDEGGSVATGWTEIDTIFKSCAGCHTGGSCTGGNCFLNSYQSAISAPSGSSCSSQATSIECGLARAKDGTMPLGGCSQVPCISDVAVVEAWIADGMPE
jgi:hypothetical protein